MVICFGLQMFVVMNPKPFVQSRCIMFLNAFEDHFVFCEVVVAVIFASLVAVQCHEIENIFDVFIHGNQIGVFGSCYNAPIELQRIFYGFGNIAFVIIFLLQ